MLVIMKTTEEEAVEFLEKDILKDISELSLIDDYGRKIIKESLKIITGMDYGFIPCLSRVDGEPPALGNSNIFTFLETYDSNYLFKVEMDDNLCCSIPIDILLDYMNNIENVGEDGISIYAKRLSRIFIANQDSPNIITFIPYVTFNNIRDIKLLNEEWEVVEVDTPTLKECENKCMKYF